MKCLVTGGAGFIGSHIVDKLVNEGMNVVVLDDLSTGMMENANKKATFIQADITSFDEISAYFQDVDYVFHTAALPRIQPSFEQPIEHENVNVIGTINCLEASKSARIKKFVFSSSSSCYGNPDILPTPETAPINCLSPYALQKYTAEQYCMILGERFDIPVLALRYFNVYGPRSFNPKNPYNAYTSVIGIFNNQKKNGQKLTITGDGEQSRDFVHVYDVAQANIDAALSDFVFKIYNVGYGKDYTINEVARMFSSDVTYIPERKGEARITLANIEKISRELGWQPKISLEEGVNLLDV